MLISPPFLPPRATNQTDEAWINLSMNGDLTGLGAYPVSFNLGWHGGLHLDAPAGPTTSGNLPVVAIADGTIVYVRKPTPKPAEPIPADSPLYYRGGWSSDGCVVIKHETEIGTGENGKVVYYSIIMHLHTLRPNILKGRPIYRKDEIGQAGYIYGRGNKIHIEIICDDDNLNKMIGRLSSDLPTDLDGRTDAVYGELYFHLPSGTQIYVQQPADNQPTPTTTAVHNLATPLIVGLRYSSGEGPHPGGACVTTYHEDGTLIENAEITEPESEYKLYARATAISKAYQDAHAAQVPAPSAVYELLRFGRIINIENETLTPADTPHWRKIRFEGGEGWVNLNKSDVTEFSDADFPPWKGWQLIADDTNGDSRCDSTIIKGWLDQNSDGKVDRNEAMRLVTEESIKAKLRRAICKTPTEWEKATLETRCGWLKQVTEANVTPLLDADFQRLMNHVKALCFWEEADIGISSEHWHFEPREFIRHFRRCGWLSKGELTRIYTKTPKEILAKFLPELNKMMRKYLIQSGVRQSHFLGQGAVESTFMTAMQESSMQGTIDANKMLGKKINPESVKLETAFGHWYGANKDEDDPYFRLEKYNSKGVRITGSYNWVIGNMGAIDAQKFRGRGFKQLTGRDNYAGYWIYRGWISQKSFDANWWTDPLYKIDTAKMHKKAAVINNPEVVATIPFNCMDSGGWYMTFRRPKVISTIDTDIASIALSLPAQESEKSISKKVTHAINGGEIAWDKRLEITRKAKVILL